MNQSRRTVLHGLLALPASSQLTTGGILKRDVTARNGVELRAALRMAAPGTVITLTPGDFGDVAQFDLATPEVTLRAAEPLRSVLRAPVVVSGAGATLADLAFLGEGDEGVFLAAVVACGDFLSITAPDVEVRGCDFGYFPNRAIIVRPHGLRPYIHDCRFHDNRSGGDENAHEAISLGYDNPNSRISMRGRVINNRFWNLNVEGEAVSVKTSDNTLQGNQINDSRGAFSGRYGARNIFADNISTNSQGIVVAGRGCRILNNRVIGLGIIAVQAGNASAESITNGVHPQSVDTYVEGNTGQLTIGGKYRPMPAANTTVRGHSGFIRLLLHTGTNL